MTPTGLYIDFPFCLSRCSFCAFNIQGYREGLADTYLSALQKELALQAKTAIGSNRIFTSIYFGGGTPSLYPAEALVEILSYIRTLFSVSDNAEITLEAHPATIDAAKLTAFRRGGINRLSMGAQSFSDAHLEALGRRHTADQTRTAFYDARAAGFTNIGIDLIYALPEQTLSDWEETLAAAIALGPEHLSLYGLSIEPGTLFYKKEQAGALVVPSEAESILFYETAQARLRDANYLQYEISNFARSGFSCRHNLLYWDRGDVLGVGLSAHSHLSAERRVNTDALETYLAHVSSGTLPIEQVEPISEESALRDKIIFGLRKIEGISRGLLEEKPSLQASAARLILAGLLKIESDLLRLTPKGILLADEVAVAFI